MMSLRFVFYLRTWESFMPYKTHIYVVAVTNFCLFSALLLLNKLWANMDRQKRKKTGTKKKEVLSLSESLMFPSFYPIPGTRVPTYMYSLDSTRVSSRSVSWLDQEQFQKLARRWRLRRRLLLNSRAFPKSLRTRLQRKGCFSLFFFSLAHKAN